jgi:hypothetical protein
LPIGLDWIVFYPAVRAFLHGDNPYLVGDGFSRVFEPFWTYLILSPFALLPYWPGRILLFVVSLLAFAYTAHRLGAVRWQLVLYLLSAPVAGCLANGNIDWLVLSGVWMPPWLGLFFVCMKPQIGIGIAVFWAWEAWRLGGLRRLVRTFAPVTMAYLLSFALYGFWILHLGGMGANQERITGFPWVVPIGLYVLYRALRDHDSGLALASGPFLSPYVSQFNYAAVLLGLLRRPRAFLIAWVLLWCLVGIRFLT